MNSIPRSLARTAFISILGFTSTVAAASDKASADYLKRSAIDMADRIQTIDGTGPLSSLTVEERVATTTKLN